MNRRRARLHARLADYGTIDYVTREGSSERPPIAFLEPWLFRLLYGPTGEGDILTVGDTKLPLLVEVFDDSMEPTIPKGALALVDRSFGISPAMRAHGGSGSVHDGIYLFELSPLAKGSERPQTQWLIRRVLYKVDGTMIIRCDNQTYPEEIYDTRKRPTPSGRVVWHAHQI